MALVTPESIFDFDRYRRLLGELTQDGDAFAQSMVAGLTRIRQAQDTSLQQLAQLATQISSVNFSIPAAATASLGGYGERVSQLAKQTELYRQQIAELQTAEQAQATSVTDLSKMLGILERDFKDLKSTQTDYAQRQTEIAGKVTLVARAITAQSSVLKEAKRSVELAEGSYAKLAQETSEMRQILLKMPDAFDRQTNALNRNNKAAVDMQRQIDRNNRALKQADAAMGMHGRKVGDYANALQGVGSQALSAAGAIIGVSSALEAVTAGLKIISDMERIDAALQAVSKDSNDFRQTQEYLIATANTLGLRYEVLAKSYKGLKAATNGTALEGRATQQIFSGLVRSGAALKLSNEEVEGAILAVTQMMSKGKVSAEELRQQLAERLPGAVRLLAEAMGVSEAKLNKMMQQGELLAVDVLPKLAKQLDKTYGANAQSNIETMAGGWNILTNEVHLFVAALDDNKAISATTNNFQTMIAETLKGMREAVRSSDWKTFFGAFAVGPFNVGGIGTMARQQIANNARNSTTLEEYKTMSPEMRQARRGITQDNIDRNTKRVSEFPDWAWGGEKDKIQNLLNADKQLMEKLNKAERDLRRKERKDNEQEDINAGRAAAIRKEQDAERLEKEAKKKEAARRKAQAEADKRLNNALGLTKAGTAKDLAGVDADEAAGKITEREALDRNYQITVAGIRKRQDLMKKAGKTETDDYRMLAAELAKEQADYIKKKLKIDEDGFKKQLETVKSSLSEIDKEQATRLQEALGELDRIYAEDAGKVKQQVASKTISQSAGELQLHNLKLKYLADATAAVDQAYAEDARLSQAVTEQKIAALNAYKLAAERTPAEILEAEENIVKLEKQLRDDQAADDKARLDKQSDYKKKKAEEDAEHETKTAAKAAEARKDLLNAAFQTAGTIGSAISDILNANSQHDLDVLSKQKERELAMAGDNADARAKIEDDYAKKEADIRRKQAIAQRAAALFAIAINTAQAVTAVLSTGGGAHYLDFGVSAGILSAFVTAAGVAQAAAVLASPLPGFWKGTSYAPEGPAHLAERGPEFRQKKDGTLKYYAKPTIDYLDRGDRIYTAGQTKALIDNWQRQEVAQQALQQSMLNTNATTQLRAGRFAEMQFMMNGQGGLTEKGVARAMSTALADQPAQVTKIDRDGFHEYLEDKNSRTEYLNTRNRFR